MKETGKVFGVLQRVGRAFMLPIAVLPVAGLLLGIGRSLTNETDNASGLSSDEDHGSGDYFVWSN